MTANSEIIPESELILNPDGSIYHLNLLPEDIGSTIILVGDPERVPKVSKYFDSIEIQKQRREFVTHTGWLNGKKFTVLSTGIGTDNIDIVLNELDALVNINLSTRQINPIKKSLKLVRIGTCGSLREDVLPDQMIVSTHGIGLDALLHYYGYNLYENESIEIDRLLNYNFLKTYIAPADANLLAAFRNVCFPGITVSCTGFYAPQGRFLRTNGISNDLILRLNQLPAIENEKVVNFEMETSAIYGLAHLMGHQALSVNAVIGNRIKHIFSKDPYQTIDKTIRTTLNILANM